MLIGVMAARDIFFETKATPATPILAEAIDEAVATESVRDFPDHVLGDDEDIADVLCKLFAPAVAEAQAEYDCRAKFWNETKDVPDVKGEVVIDCGEGPWCDCIDTVGPFRVGAIRYRPGGGALSNLYEVHAYCSHRERIGGRLLVGFQCE